MDWQFIGKLFLGAFYTSGNMLVAIPTYVALLPILLYIFAPKWGARMKKVTVKEKRERTTKYRIIAAIFFVLLLFTSLILSANHLYQSKEVKFATPDSLIAPTLTSMNISIADLVRTDQIIRNKTFVNCWIYGPAIIVNSSGYVTINGAYFEESPLRSFILTDQTYYYGVIGLENCTFIDCHFIKIGFAGTQELKDKIANAIINK